MANKHIGSSFDDFLAEEAMREEATATAMKRVIAWQIEQEMKAQKLTKRRWRNVCVPVGQGSIACSTPQIQA
jgi:hypothetical protein